MSFEFWLIGYWLSTENMFDNGWISQIELKFPVSSSELLIVLVCENSYNTLFIQ